MIQRRLLRSSQLVCQSSRYHIANPVFRSRSILPNIASATYQRIPRLYTTATDTADAATTDAPPSTDPSSSQLTPEDNLRKDLESKTREVIDLKDRYLRSVADFRNLQDRTKRDVDTARSFAISRFAADLVESVDNLDRALGTVPQETLSNSDENKELVNLYDGLKMTETILMQTLKKHGLERFDPSEEGEMFNPNLHEATFQTKVEGKQDGSVFTTQQKGFLLNGRVVRAAKVGVVKNT